MLAFLIFSRDFLISVPFVVILTLNPFAWARLIADQFLDVVMALLSHANKYILYVDEFHLIFY